MRPGRPTRRADEADGRAPAYPLSEADVDSREVRIHGAQGAAVRDGHEIAPAAGMPSRKGNAARGGGTHLGPHGGGEVETGVESSTARAEAVAGGGCNRTRQRERCTRRRRE